MSNPLVSVIIPVWNGERYLADAVESVLNQTHSPGEIIIVDDGSTDRSAEEVKRFGSRVRYFFQPNQGAAAARNQGVKWAQGSLVAFLDADDIWLKDKLTRQMFALEQDSELDMVFGHVQQFYDLKSAGSSEGKTSEFIAGYFAGTLLIKRDSFSRAGWFSPDWRVGEFIDWYLRAKDQGLKSIMLPEVVLKRRIHDANMGIRERASRVDYVKIIKASLDRRRKGS